MGIEARLAQYEGLMRAAQSLGWENPHREFEKNYTPPIVFQIAGIPTAIVDPHNEVVHFWAQLGRPVVVLTFDKHQDVSPVPARNGQGLLQYIRTVVWNGGFIPAAMNEGIVAALYHFNPYYPVTAMDYGRVRDGRVVESAPFWVDNRKEVRVEPKYLKPWGVSLGRMLRDIRSSGLPFVVDIDLDALLCEHKVRLGYGLRLRTALWLCSHLPRPGFITIATSQTPRSYVPKNDVEQVKRDTVTGLLRIYSTQ